MDVLHSFLSAAPHPTEGVKDALRLCTDRDLVARVEETARTTGKVVLQMAAVRRLAELSTAICPACQRDREVDASGNFKVHLLRDGDVGAGACPGSRQPAGALVATEPVAKAAPAEKPAPAPAPSPEPVALPAPSLPSDPRHARAVRLGALESVLQRAGWTEVARAAWWTTVEGRESFLDGDPGDALVRAGVLKTASAGADLPDLWRDNILAWVQEHIAAAQAGMDVVVLALCEAVDAAGPTDVAALVALSKRAAQLDGPVADALARWVARVSPPPAPVAESGPINRAWEQRVSQMTVAPELVRELDRAYGLLSPRQQDMVDRVKVDPSHWGILRREVDVSGLGTDPCSRRGKGDTLSAALEDDRPLLLTLLVRAKASAVLRGEAPDTKTIAAIEKAYSALMAGERLRVIKPAWDATGHTATCQCGRSVGLLHRRDEALVLGLHAGDSGAACRWSFAPVYDEPEEQAPNVYQMQCPIPSCRTEVLATWDGERLQMPRHINPTHLGACPGVTVPQKHWPMALVARLNAPVGYIGALGGELPLQVCPECWSVDIPTRLWRAGDKTVCYAPHRLSDGSACSYVAGPPVQEDDVIDAEREGDFAPSEPGPAAAPGEQAEIDVGESPSLRISDTLDPAVAAAPTIHLSQLGGIDRHRGVPRDRPPVNTLDATVAWQREWDACDADMRSGLPNSVPFVQLLTEVAMPSDDDLHADDLREMLIERGYLLPGDERPMRVALAAALDSPTDEDGVDLSEYREYREMIEVIEGYLTGLGELGDNEERQTSEVVIDLLRRYSRRHNEMASEKESAQGALRDIGFALGLDARAEQPKEIARQAIERLRQAGKPHHATVVEVGGNPPTAILQVECDVATAQRFGRLLYQGVDVWVDEGGEP